MSKKVLYSIILSTILLASCTNNNIKYDNFDNFDIDQINEITEDNDSSEADSQLSDIEQQEESLSIPPSSDQYDAFTDNKLTLDGGKYYLKGDYSDISITASKNSELYIYLDGVNITSSKGIAFSSKNAITLHLIILNNSINYISNDYVVSEELPEANAFHVKGNVYISGEGTLNVASTVKSGIKVSKDLYILGDNLEIISNSKSHSITSQSLSIIGSKLTLTSSEKDGINVESDNELTSFDDSQGYVNLENSNIIIEAYGDGIQASTYVNISGGSLDIKTNGSFVQYNSSLVTSGEYEASDFKFMKNGSEYIRVGKDEIKQLSSIYYALTGSFKGIKVAGMESKDASGNLRDISVGDYIIKINHLANVKIDSFDDSIHCNYGKVNLKSSNIELTSIDDGVHADYDLNVDNSSIVIKSSFEGLEGSNVTIDGEKTNIISISSDDGINAASDYSSNNVININNGYLRVYASGDGIDANTTLNINGGTVIVEGPGNNNGSLDANRVNINGGLIFACSTNGMQEKTYATQNAFLYQGNTMSKDSLITIADSNNEALFSYTLKQSCNQIIFSCNDLQLNSTYKILSGSSVVTSIKLTSTFTTISSRGGFGPNGDGPGPGRR